MHIRNIVRLIIIYVIRRYFVIILFSLLVFVLIEADEGSVYKLRASGSPGESSQADIGISLPGSGESPVAPVYVRGEKVCALKGDDMQARFHAMIEEFVQTTYGASSRGQSDN